jgi:hypothetical protein
MTTRDDLVRRLRKQHQQCGVDESGPVFELVPICQEAASALEAKDAEIAELANDYKDRGTMISALVAERAGLNTRITSLERQLAEETERCGSIGDQIDGGLQLLLAAVHANDPKREILVRVGDLLRDAAAIRGGAK